ncbi:MAG TPA: phosphoribosylanthranilate isomerase [Acidimicrobiales bacterium]|nr:phosphoribosylanthranilate isomerase [Acidimicrobiales bacterium]
MTESDPYFIKICGMTTLGDANAAIDAGASAIGLILASSPRQLTLDRALAIAAGTKDRVLRILVFRDNDDESIIQALELIDADFVQLHGPVSDELSRQLRKRSVRVIKALSIGTEEFFEFDDGDVDAVLIDGAAPGSGASHSWDELADRSFAAPIIAAGGLDSMNVAEIIVGTTVWGVDVASGVESSPGVKDRDQMKHFIEQSRTAFRERAKS